MRNHHLRAGFCAEGAALKERLGIPHAALVNVEARFDVIDSVHDKIKSLPELIVEDIFRFMGQVQLEVFDVEAFIHAGSDGASNLRLGLSHVVHAEQELTV